MRLQKEYWDLILEGNYRMMDHLNLIIEDLTVELRLTRWFDFERKRNLKAMIASRKAEASHLLSVQKAAIRGYAADTLGRKES